jgi:hypothetical protein
MISAAAVAASTLPQSSQRSNASTRLFLGIAPRRILYQTQSFLLLKSMLDCLRLFTVSDRNACIMMPRQHASGCSGNIRQQSDANWMVGGDAGASSSRLPPTRFEKPAGRICAMRGKSEKVRLTDLKVAALAPKLGKSQYDVFDDDGEPGFWN